MTQKDTLPEITLPKDISDKLMPQIKPGRTIDVPENLMNGLQTRTYCKIGDYKGYIVGSDPKDKIYEILIVEKINNGNRI